MYFKYILKLNNNLQGRRSVFSSRNIGLLAVATAIAVGTLTGCKKLVDVASPSTSISSADVYANDATAAAVLTGIYTTMSNANFSFGGLSSLSFYTGMSADELTLYSGANNPTYTAYYTNALTNSNTGGSDYWNNIYPLVYITNSAVQGLTNSATLTPSVKQQLLGEAKFMRAFSYFYLVNLYGPVPLVTGTDFTVNQTLSRSPELQVYQQIITDLNDAQHLLSNNYLDASVVNLTSERVRPTKAAALAMLARVYLYFANYSNNSSYYTKADSASTAVISNNAYSLATLNDVFLKNSTESIWQLQPVQIDWNTPDAQLFIIPQTGPSGNWPVYLSVNLLGSFEVGDQRRVNWTNSLTDTVNGVITTYYYPYKYKIATLGAPVTEYEMVLRLAEQYLIRAEAKANLNDGTAATDLDVIRTRAGLPTYSGATDKASLLKAILHERQVELFTEWGHRWLDLKRTGTVDQVMGIATPQKGSTWNSYQQWYPISLNELQHDPKLIQNNGY